MKSQNEYYTYRTHSYHTKKKTDDHNDDDRMIDVDLHHKNTVVMQIPSSFSNTRQRVSLHQHATISFKQMIWYMIFYILFITLLSYSSIYARDSCHMFLIFN